MKRVRIDRKLKTKRNEIIIWLLVIVLAVVLALIFYSASKPKTSTNVLAEVNGIKIVQDDLNEIALTVPASLRANFSAAELLEQAINFEIIRQEAAKIGVTITDDEVEKNIDSLLSSVGLTKDDLKKSIAAQNIAWNTLFNAYKKQLLSYKFLNATILKNITVTEEQIKEIYNQYSKQINASYEDVKDDINRTILSMKSQEFLGRLLEQKRKEYNIVRYVHGS